MKRILPVLGLALAVALVRPPAAEASPDSERLAGLRDLYARHDKKISEYVEAELLAYLDHVTKPTLAAEARYLLGRVRETAGDEEAAVAAYLSVARLYPESDFAGRSTEELDRLLTTERAYKDRADDLRALRDEAEIPADGADRVAALVELMESFEIDELAGEIARESRSFLLRHPGHSRAPAVALSAAKALHRAGEEHEAEAAYFQIERMYPATPWADGAALERARLLSRDLDRPDEALEVLARLVAGTSDPRLADEALYLRAEIHAEEQKDYEAAVTDYHALADRSPEGPLAAPALLEVGRLREKKLKHYQGAVDAYVAAVDHGAEATEAVDALHRASDLLLDELENPGEAAEVLARVARDFPETEKASEALLDAAKIAEKKLESKAKAEEYYQEAIRLFPDTETAREAAKKIEDLREG
jgi:TolA-binding protein